MLAELSIIPVGEGTHSSEQIAIALKFVDASGLLYQLTPSGTCIEGEWDQVMSVIRQCHERVRSISPHVITLIKIVFPEFRGDLDILPGLQSLQEQFF